MLARIRKDRENGEAGFTLIELLVVVIIIGILSAIAIPTFLNQREKAWEKAAMSDLRNAAVVMEEQFEANDGTYAGATGWRNSENVVVTLAAGADENGYCLTSTHASLPDAEDTFTLDSTTGVVDKTPTATGSC